MRYCLGTVQFGLDYGIQGNGKPEEEKVFEMLDYAIREGVSVFDTASAYGESETILGAYIRKKRDKSERMQVISKLDPNAFDGKAKGDWGKIAIKNAKYSLGRIGISKFKAYLFHNSKYIFNKDAVLALNEVKIQGFAERIGVSVYNPDEAMKALEYPEVSAIQIPYNIFDHRLDNCGFFEQAKQRNVFIFARSSLLQGLLMMNPDCLPPKVSFAKKYILQFLKICDNFGVSPLRCATGYVGSKREIDYVVFGADDYEQLQEYISIRDKDLPLELIEEINEQFYNVEEKLVNPALW